jgi:hypothetical protein
MRGRKRIGEGIARYGSAPWRRPDYLTERVVALAAVRAERSHTRGWTFMRNHKLVVGLSAAVLCVAVLLPLTGVASLASVVEAGKRWFNLAGSEHPKVCVPEGQDAGDATAVARVRIVHDGSGEQTVRDLEVKTTGLNRVAYLEKLEKAVAEGRYTVEATTGTLGEAMSAAMPADASCPAPTVPDPDRNVDIYTFRTAEGAVEARVFADRETHEVISVLRTRVVTVCSDGEQPAEDPALACGDENATVRVVIGDDGKLRVTVTESGPGPVTCTVTEDDPLSGGEEQQP